MSYGTELSPKELSVKDAVKTLIDALSEDEGYYYGWQSNIAMAFKDEYNAMKKTKLITPENLHIVANNGAKKFLDMFIYLNKK